MKQPPPLQLDDVIGEITRRVSYLRAETSAPADEGWLRCAELCAGGPSLRGLIAETGEGRGTSDPDVAASLFAQAYAFRVGAIPLAAYALELPSPNCAPEVTAISIARHRPSAIAFTDGEVTIRDAIALADALGDHLDRFHTAVRGEVTVGERLLWGNAASSFARVFRAIESAPDVDSARVRSRAEELFAAAGERFAGLGTFATVTVDDRDGWFWTRTSCCLWYQASGGSMCDDCSLIKPDELHDRRIAEVAGNAS